MGGAGDGEIDKYEFKACMRNNLIGIGNEKIVDMLFREIDKDKSGAITFQEFASVMNKDDHAHNKNNWFVGGGHNRNNRGGRANHRAAAPAPIPVIEEEYDYDSYDDEELPLIVRDQLMLEDVWKKLRVV